MEYPFGLFWLILAAEIGAGCIAVERTRRADRPSTAVLATLGAVLALRILVGLPFAGLWGLLSAAIGGAEVILLAALHIGILPSGRTATKFLAFALFLCLLGSATVHLYSGFFAVARNAKPFIETRRISSTLQGEAVVGHDPQQSDVPSLASLSDDRHARIYRENGQWCLQNISLSRHVVVRGPRGDLNPHELPLPPGMRFSVNGREFQVLDQSRPYPFFSEMKMRGPDGGEYFAKSTSSFILGTSEAHKADFDGLPGPAGERLAKISFDRRIRWKDPFSGRTWEYSLPMLEALIFGTVIVLLGIAASGVSCFTKRRKPGKGRPVAAGILAFVAIVASALILYSAWDDIYSKGDTWGRFVLKHFDSGDKARALILYDGQNNLLERSVPLLDKDRLILGYTHFLFEPGCKGNRFSLSPVRRASRFSLPEQGPFVLVSEYEPWNDEIQILAPLALSSEIRGTVSRRGDKCDLLLKTRQGPPAVVRSGESFSVKDAWGNDVEFTFGGMFSPTTLKELFRPPPSLVKGEIWKRLAIATALFFAVAFLFLATKRLEGGATSVYLGAMVLAGTGGLFLYRLEIVSARHDGAALSQITFAIAGIAVMASAAFFASVPRFLEKRRIKRELKKETRKSDCDVQKQDALEEELRLARLKGWEIYDFFQKNAFAGLNIPTLSLGLLLVLFLVQRGLGSETGIHLVAFNLQPVFPALAFMAAVLAYGTAEDLAVGEGEASGLPERPALRQYVKFGDRIWHWSSVKYLWRLSIYQWRLLYWRYQDLIWCSAAFIASMLLVKDLAPIFLFFCICLSAWFLRSRLGDRTLLICGALSAVAAAVALLFFMAPALPLMPEFLEDRLGVWLAPFEYTSKAGHFIDNLWLLKEAGPWGNGLGISENVANLAEIEDDFILALVLSDTGVVGLGALAASFLLIVLPCFVFGCGRIGGGKGKRFSSNAAKNEIFYRTLVFWLANMFTVQLLIVGAMATGLLPIMGLPVPFVGKGGSSLVFFSFLSTGLILAAMREVGPGESMEERLG